MTATIPQAVLIRYSPAFTGLRWASVSGGFSGAGVWRGETPDGAPIFALKAWPATTTRERLQAIHVWIARAGHLPFVPKVLRTSDGDTVVSHGDRVWDATNWMPGVPVVNPSVAELETAGVAVARLHRAWPVERVGVCPGVINRLRLLDEFRNCRGRVSSNELTRRGWQLVSEKLDWATALLRPLESMRFPLQPCVRDLRAEHVLFSQGKISGVVDYGAMAVDFPVVDLARLFGEYAVGETHRAEGLLAYQHESGALVSEEILRILEQTGAVCSAVNWLLRLLATRQNLIEEPAVLSRFGELLARIERFAPK